MTTSCLPKNGVRAHEVHVQVPNFQVSPQGLKLEMRDGFIGQSPTSLRDSLLKGNVEKPEKNNLPPKSGDKGQLCEIARLVI
jgi:hypothetical protein